jgi:exopolyphosphatase/guanosine-5'-triphosphate,3'-diphosphate pyrophosphatase
LSNPSPGRRLAAIDIGTNSIRMVVAEVEGDGTYRILDEERDMARLGKDLYRTGRLAADSVDRALAALTRMKAIIDGFDVVDLQVVATAAVRDAANGPAFRREVQRRLKMRVDVISPEEEAQLAFQSAARHFEVGGRPVAVVDIGGGSMEVVLAVGGVVEQVHSLPLGAVRLTEAYVRSDPLKDKEWKKLRNAIDDALEEHLRRPPFQPELLIGSGGTFTNAAEMIMADREGQTGPAHGYAITRSDLDGLVGRLRTMPLEVRQEMPGLNPRRADIIVAGVAAVARLVRRLGVRSILVNERGIRDGLLLSMIGGEAAAPGTTPDRMESVAAFARKCRSTERHNSHVATLAGQLFDGLRRRMKLPADARDLLVAASLLHDVGALISHAGRHKHAYHLIVHSDLRGFSAREIQIIANVARYHRGALPKKRHANFGPLRKPDRGLVRALAGMLRVACGLDRTHTQRVAGLRCSWRAGDLRIALKANSDPQVEVGEALRKADLLAKELRARVRLAWSRKRGRLRVVRGQAA